MKQTIVIKVSVHSPKCRSKALKISVGVSGVVSAAIKGKDKDELEVTGEDIDVVKLTKLIRKNVGPAELVSVAEKKEEKKPDEKLHPLVWSGYYPYGGTYQISELREPWQGCSIL